MHLLSVENISKSYSEKTLLQDISLGISQGDKIGLIGINGTGKTTLLRIIAGLEKPDAGEIVKSNRLQIAFLSQDPDFDPETGVLEQVFRSNKVLDLVREYNLAIADPNASGEKIARLAREMDQQDAWSLESDARAILTKLGCDFFDAKMGTLSGGQKKRVALAGTLLQSAELMILDEPTNHLDSEAIEWLEQYLAKRKGALLMITHDRYFLDRVVNRIIELDSGVLYSYKGNYSYYLQKKLKREDIATAREEKRRNVLRKELAWIKRGAKARTTKQKARIQRFEQLKEQRFDNPVSRLEISVAGSRLGKKIVEMEQVSKGYDDLNLIEDFSLILDREDRIGIVGPNGSGKTTLLNLMSGMIAPDRGKVQIGETVKVGVYAQEMPQIDPSQRVIQYIREDAEQITTAEGETISAAQMLERFLFPPDLQWSLVEKLSGGERRRLNLLKVLVEGPNVLLLDEPTNDLDVETLAILEDYLENFKGAIVAVSHDRYFLDRMADKLLVFEGDGRIRSYPGNYTHYKERKEQELREMQGAALFDGWLAGRKGTGTDTGKNSGKYCGRDGAEEPKEGSKEFGEEARKGSHAEVEPKTAKEKPRKLSYKEQKEYEEIEGIINGLEEKIAGLQAEIEAAGADYLLLEKLCSQAAELEERLNDKLERWVYLNEIAEKTGKR